MKFDSLIFKLCSHFGAPRVPKYQKPELLVNNSSKENFPIPKVIKILKRPTNPVMPSQIKELRPKGTMNQTEEPRFREPPKITELKDFSIAIIGGAAFQTVAHQKGTSIIMSELDKQLTGSKDNIHLNKISEMMENEKKGLRIKVPTEFHDFLDFFDRKAAEVLPSNQTYNHVRARCTTVCRIHVKWGVIA